MHQSCSLRVHARRRFNWVALFVCALACSVAVRAQNPSPVQATPPASVQHITPPAGSPARVVLDFYQALRERKFREAFAMSIWKPAIDGLTPAEFEELRPEFERMAAAVPEQIDISGEQISGDTATVFARVGDDPSAQPEAIQLMRAGSVWIFGDRDKQAEVQRLGKEFFPTARIEQHHAEVEAILLRIANAEAGYAATRGGVYADLPTLIDAKPSLHDDVESEDTLGYHFHLTVARDGRSYTVGAEPLHYGHTGRFSYFMDASGYKKKDTGGKPYTPSAKDK